MTNDEMKELRVKVLPKLKDLLLVDKDFTLEHIPALNTDDAFLPVDKDISYLVIRHKNDDIPGRMNHTHVGVGFRYCKIYVDLHVDCENENMRIERLNRLTKLYFSHRVDNKYILQRFDGRSNKEGEYKGLVVEYDEYKLIDIVNDIYYLCDLLDIII